MPRRNGYSDVHGFGGRHCCWERERVRRAVRWSLNQKFQDKPSNLKRRNRGGILASRRSGHQACERVILLLYSPIWIWIHTTFTSEYSLKWYGAGEVVSTFELIFLIWWNYNIKRNASISIMNPTYSSCSLHKTYNGALLIIQTPLLFASANTSLAPLLITSSSYTHSPHYIGQIDRH